MSSSSPDSSLLDKTSIIVAFLITVGLATLYFFNVGIIAIWPDSLLFADRARHLLEEGRPALSLATTTSYQPLYSLLMAVAFLVPNFLLSHQILIGFQLLLLCSVFFPIRRLLLTCEGVGRSEASALSVIVTLSATALPYATMLSSEALFIPLFVWFTYFYDKFLSTDKPCAAASAGICLGLLLLTKEIGWVIYGAVLINTLIVVFKKQPVQQLFNLQIIPLLLAAAWLIYNTIVLGQTLELPHLELNNALARFNFFKNGVVYLFYMGMPLAGLAFLISCFSKKHPSWGSAFYRFAFFALLGVLIYITVTNVIIVEGRLDYITNRVIEPFILLPLIIFLRLPFQQREEITANSMLIFFCMMLFGLPYALKTDFITGMAYWSQSMGNPNLGIIRNVIYCLLLSLPIIIIWWKPKFFILTYATVSALFTFSNVMQNQAVWSISQEGNLKYVNTEAYATNPDIKNASALYVETRCNMMQSQDISYLFRCNDMSKLLYFVPRHITAISAQELSNLSLKNNDYVLFVSSENDNAIGKTVAQIGLGNLLRVEQADLDALRLMPLVRIESVEKLGQYINIPINHKMERVTLLGPDATFHLQSNKAGCINMNIKLAFAASKQDGNQKKVEFLLNKKSVKQAVVEAPVIGNPQQEYQLSLALSKGANSLQLNYKNEKVTPGTLDASIMMFGLPNFTACKK